MDKKNIAVPVTIGTCFSVAAVWFGTHVGGGFATGNQAIQYFVKYGWVGAIMPLLSMALLAWVIREGVIFARSRGIYNYKEVFTELWQPYPKLSLSFELFFYIIAISAVGAAVAGAATLLTEIGLPYILAVGIVGVILLCLTIFGADLVAKASTVFSIGILIASFLMYFIGIKAEAAGISAALSPANLPFGGIEPAWKMIVYTGFQCVSLPAVLACCKPLKTKKSINTAMFMGFLMNGLALAISCIMLLGWYGKINAQGGDMALPNLFVCSQLEMPFLYVLYFVSLFLAFISTGVTLIFSLTVRLENAVFKKAAQSGEGIMASVRNRRIFIAFLAMLVSMLISLVGLSNIIKYAYSYCGYLSIVVIMIPMLTIGRKKNKEFLKQNPDCLSGNQPD